ncbi:MAG: 50S ribosomal protein L9, partial [Flavobacteriales bacterium]
ELILKKDVENLGFKDDIVTVKNGYGRNYLIPQGLAVMATPSARKVLAENLRQKAHKEAKILEDAQKIAKKLEAMELKITAKSADGSKLFGSVNAATLSETIAQEGVEIESKFIRIEGKTIKRAGKYTAHIRLHRTLIVDMDFDVIAEVNKPKAEVETEATEETVVEKPVEIATDETPETKE